VARILVVEDSAVDRHLIQGLLAKQSDWEVMFAANGQEALEALEKNLKPDVIVTDLRMPEMDGLELVRQVRLKYPQIPVVLITSHGSEQIAIDALRMGATSYSPKNAFKIDLVRSIGQVLSLTEHLNFDRLGLAPATTKQIAFVLENEMSFIGPTIEHFQANLPSWSDRDRLQIGMALDEAISNAMHHGNLEVDSKLRDVDDGNSYYEVIRGRKTQPPFCHRRVKIEAEFSDQHICVQITDDGPGFDPAQIPDPTDEENLLRPCGRGLFLIRAFMDTVAHNKTGNQITMTKLRREEPSQ